MRASWGPSSSGWARLLLMPCTNWGILSATAWNEINTHYIHCVQHFKVKGENANRSLMNEDAVFQNIGSNFKCTWRLLIKVSTWSRLNSHTLQLCTNCWCEAVFLLEAAAFWAAAMVWVAAAAACFAAICSQHTNGYSWVKIHFWFVPCYIVMFCAQF